MTQANPKTVWILTDGKAGDLAQCRGIAAYFPDCEIDERVVNPGWRGAIPFPFIGLPSDEKLVAKGSPLAPPFPDLVIASGRRTIPYLKTIKKRAPETKNVFLKDPKWLGRSAADLVWIPNHDNAKTSGNNIIRTDTSPHAFTAEVLAKARASGHQRFNGMEKPFVSIILGGNSASVKWDGHSSNAFAEHLKTLPTKSSILITASRRTPDVLMQAVKAALADRTVWIWDETSKNPYPQMLAIADQIIVTGDSHNMVSEAVSTGAQVFVFRPKGLKTKFHRFLNAMEAQGAIKNLAVGLSAFAPKTVDATPQIAEAVRELLKR